MREAGGDRAARAGLGAQLGAQLGAEPGLCLTCRHALLNQTRRGTVYLRCGRSAWDERLVRYPRLPVIECAGFEALQTGHAAGTTDRSAEKLRPEPGRRPAVRAGSGLG